MSRRAVIQTASCFGMTKKPGALSVAQKWLMPGVAASYGSGSPPAAFTAPSP